MLRSIGVLCAAALALAGLSVPAQADNDPADGKSLPAEENRIQATSAEAGLDKSAVAEVQENQRAEQLGKNWKTSKDQAWTLVGDGSGLHVLVADAKDGYRWRTVATLVEPAFTTDRWVGNACVAGNRAVVAYAPRMFTNKPILNERGAFAAVVDLGSGKVTKLAQQVSLAHFNPSCGNRGRALFTQEGGEKRKETRLVSVDMNRARVTGTITAKGQLTSAVPTRFGVVAADGNRIVSVASTGTKRALATTSSVPFGLSVDRQGRVAYLDHKDGRASVRRLDQTRLVPTGLIRPPASLVEGDLERMGLTRSAAGDIAVLGRPEEPRSNKQTGLTLVRTDDVNAKVSSSMALLVETPRILPLSPSDAGESTRRPAEITARSLKTNKDLTFAALPVAGAGDGSATESPALKRSASAKAKTGSGTKSISPDNRTCSVPVNDPHNMAIQPKPRQVEWAVNQAVQGVLNVERPANWKNLGMPAYSPQGLFPLKRLRGISTSQPDDPSPSTPPFDPKRLEEAQVPAQVMLGILAQESNMWQTSGSFVPGLAGSPLVGNYFGRQLYDGDPSNDWEINFADADCGYGVAQVTDGMRLAGKERPGETALPYQTQRAVALDFATNVAAGLNILIDKWNQVADAGLMINNGDPESIENWFYAAWAYNSGLHPKGEDANGNWGLGWFNNPANPRYPANRHAFLDSNTYVDATHPQDWPYPEKVMGWAAWPPSLLESPDTWVPGYRAAWWNGYPDNEADKGKTANQNRREVKPPLFAFCDDSNNCNPTDRCPSVDSQCWFHKSVSWKDDCDYSCGNSFIRFPSGWEYQRDGTPFLPNCDTGGAPEGSWIIDDINHPWTSPRDLECTRAPQSGRFSIKAASMWSYLLGYEGVTAGYGDHALTGITQHPSRGASEVVGRWDLGPHYRGWARILVHIPSVMAQTQQARYTVHTGASSKERILLQRIKANEWRSLGVFNFTGQPAVSLTNFTHDGNGNPAKDARTLNNLIAWDAIAVQPLPNGKPRDIVVSLGDSFSSGEGVGSYFPETHSRADYIKFFGPVPYIKFDEQRSNFCHRSKQAWSRLIPLHGSESGLGVLSDQFSPTTEHSFVACSGAETKHVGAINTLLPGESPIPEATTQWGELSQIDRGFLDQDTSLVTMSIGGNDIGFGKIVAACATETHCQDVIVDDYGWEEPLRDAVPDHIQSSVKAIKSTVKMIRRRAPNAKILIMSYPNLFSVDEDYSRMCHSVDHIPGIGAVGFDRSERSFVKQNIEYFTRSLARELKDMPNVQTIDPRPAFTEHELCTKSPWLNGIKPRQEIDEDPGLVVLSKESFHPNLEGSYAYARAASLAFR